MTKYKCENPNCGETFEEVGTYKEYHNEIEGDFYEELPCCPYCGCEDFEEVEEEPDEIEEIEDSEINVESFNFVVQVRYIAYYSRDMRNGYYYAATKEDADAIVDKYMNGKKTYYRVKLCRIYELRETKEADNEITIY